MHIASNPLIIVIRVTNANVCPLILHFSRVLRVTVVEVEISEGNRMRARAERPFGTTQHDFPRVLI